ncbi:MAG: hypothetical protein LBM56_03095 [Burkholderiaceae bacterium]|nr:hypothetical protein [Burkholderiaceae bacterium]
MAETLVRQNLDMRLRFLRGSKRMPVYEAAAAEESARILQFIADKNWGGVCKSVYLVIGIADDVLAGGDGKTKPLRKPWNQCTPERMFALEGEYDVICRPDRRIDNCSRRALMPPRREAVKLKSLANTGNIDPARYVDRMCDLYTELLRILRE